MFNFFQNIFDSAISVIVTIFVAVGLVSTPVAIPATNEQLINDSDVVMRETQEEKKGAQAEETEQLKKEVRELKKTQTAVIKEAVPTQRKQVAPAPKPKTPKTFTLPSGNVIDEKGNILYKAPVQNPAIIQLQPTQATQTTQPSSGLYLKEAEKILVTYQETIIFLLNYYQQKSFLSGQQKQNCIALYDNRIEQAKSGAGYELNTLRESGRGFARVPHAEKRIQGELEYILYPLEDEKENCSSKYAVDSSIPHKLSRIEGDLAMIKRQLNADNIIPLLNEMEDIKNDLNSIASALGLNSSF